MNKKEINELINELDKNHPLVLSFWKEYSKQATGSTKEQVCSEAMIFILNKIKRRTKN